MVERSQKDVWRLSPWLMVALLLINFVLMAFDARDFKDEIIALALQAKTGIYVDRLGADDTPESWADAIRRGAAAWRCRWASE